MACFRHNSYYWNVIAIIMVGNIFLTMTMFFVHYDMIICCNMRNKNIKTNVSDRFRFVLYVYGIFTSITHVSSYLPRPVSEVTFLHHFNATKCISTFAGWAIMPKTWILLVSSANLYPCVNNWLTKKKARKKGIFMVRYPTGLIGHVVVAPATFLSHKTTFHMSCSHSNMYVPVWYRIRYHVVSDTLRCSIGCFAWSFLYIF